MVSPVTVFVRALIRLWRTVCHRRLNFSNSGFALKQREILNAADCKRLFPERLKMALRKRSPANLFYLQTTHVLNTRSFRQIGISHNFKMIDALQDNF